MGLLKDQLLHLLTFGNHQTVTKVNNTSIIHRETFSNSASNVLLNARYALIALLGSYDLICKVRFHHQDRKESSSNNVKVKLTKFLVEKWLTLL